MDDSPIFGFAMRALVWFTICFVITSGIIAIKQSRVNSSFNRAHSDWVDQRNEIATKNHFWLMVEGKKPFTKDDTGKLAADLRNAFIARAKNDEQIDSFNRLLQGSGSYGDLNKTISEMVFPGDSSSSRSIDTDFINKIRDLEKNPEKILEKIPREPKTTDPDHAKYSVWGYVRDTDWFGILWILFSLIACGGAFLRAEEPCVDDWPEGLEEKWWLLSKEPFWQVFTIFLLLPIFLIRGVYTLLQQTVLALNCDDKSMIRIYLKRVAAERQKQLDVERKQQEEEKRKNLPYQKNLSELRESLAQMKAIRNSSQNKIPKERLDTIIGELEKMIARFEVKSGTEGQNLAPEIQQEIDLAKVESAETLVKVNQDMYHNGP